MKCGTECNEFETINGEPICKKMGLKVDWDDNCCVETCKQVDEDGIPCQFCNLFIDV